MSTQQTMNMNISNIDNLKWNELRSTVKQYGLSISGRKLDLQCRLKNYLKSQLRQEEGVQQREEVQQAKLHAHDGDGGDGLSSAAAKEETKVDTTAATSTIAPATTTPVSATAAVGIITSEQRRRMEQNRKRALELRQLREQKKLKGALSSAKEGGSNNNTAVVASANLITPATTASVKNPYAKASSSRSTLVIATPVVQQLAAQNAAASAIEKSTLFPTPQPPPPTITSAWGDCRLDLWETLCRCGGAAEHSPDIRMCQCGAAYDAGLQCDGCGCGVLLMKSGPRGNFWGCSQYKKRGCKFTKRFGAPYDREAANELAQLQQSIRRRKSREREEWLRIKDEYEKEWRSVCRCDGAKDLSTLECYMQSNGGCGQLPLCPEGCGGQLFLHQSRYGNGGGKWWGCSNYKSGICKFRSTYVEHSSS
jgi:ssDNA-binding Zn-finger/Zn-ribbon topoisomerase 1